MVAFQIAMSIAFRHDECSGFKKQLTVYLRAGGLPALSMDTLSALGISMNQKWSYDVLDQISDAERIHVHTELAKSTVSVVSSHDNVDIMQRVQEQRSDNKDLMTNGTSIVAYIVQEPSPDNRALQERRLQGGRLTCTEILELDYRASASIQAYHKWHILNVLFCAEDFDFDTYEDRDSHSIRAPPPVFALDLDKNKQPKQHVIDTILQEEKSHEGNGKVVVHALKKYGFIDNLETCKRLGLKLVLNWIGDQSTVAKVRAIPQFRFAEKNSFARADYLNAISGFLHHQIALLQSIHSQYWMENSHYGLQAGASKMERKGLRDPSTKGTFHRTLEEMVSHYAESHFRALWLRISGYNTIEELRSKSGNELLTLAGQILDEFASNEAIACLTAVEKDQRDHALIAQDQFLRDYLNYHELDDALRSGDTGRVRNMLPRLLYQYLGGKNPNYAIEVLEFLQGFEHEWPPDLV
jgi:hypothetical protein